MEMKATQRADGQLEIVIIGSENDLEKEFGLRPEEESGPDLYSRKAYCCSCENGGKHEVQASSSWSAFWKCLAKCGKAFSQTKGPCF